MDSEKRTALAQQALAGYAHGPGAPERATRRAVRKAAGSRAVILVEGISDQIAIETLAARRGRDLDAEGIVVIPVGGAQAMRRYANRFGPSGQGLALAGLCDADAAAGVRQSLAEAGVGDARTTAEMAGLGFHVCVDDLEDELIRSVGPQGVEAVLASQGDLRSFRALQRQPAWRTRSLDDQLRRFFGSGARRSLRYARLLIDAVALDRVPQPLDAVLADV